jgi:hypothetical protein
MDDAHNDVNVNASRRERAREPNQLAGLAYSFVLESERPSLAVYWQ